MNILQLIPRLNVGGVEKGTVEVAKYLTLNAHKAVVVSEGGVLEKNLAAIGARHYYLPIGRKNPFIIVYCYFRLKNIIKKENIDIIHARSRIPAISGFFAARFTHRTFITTAHGQYRKHLISRVMGWGKTVVVANETMARHMKDNFGVPLRKMTIVPRGVDLEKFSFIPPSERNTKPFRVGMVCRYTPIKGHMDFLKAMSYVCRKRHNVEIVIMGDRKNAKEEYLKKIDLAMRRLLIGNFVKFIDSKEDVADVMKNLNLLVSASTGQEAFGRSIIEAQARGVPVVATKVGGVKENVIDGKTGLLCDPMDPAGMAEKIMQYVNNLALMQDVAKNARKHVEEKYSLERTMEMTLEMYKHTLNSKNILVFKMSSLGDIILAVPSIRALRKRFPGANIKVLVDVRFRDVLNACPYIDELITCDFKDRDGGVGLLRLASKLRAEDFDISVDLQNNRRSHLLSLLGTVQERYGYDNGKWSFFINRKISLPKKEMDPISHQACVLGLLGITRIDRHLELWPDLDGEIWAEKFLEESWLKKDQKLVAMSISASNRWKTKNWGISAMVEFSDRIASEEGIRTVLVGAPVDRPEAQEFLKRTGAKPIDAVGKTNISQLINLIARCDALITGDSAPMHVAAATGTPFVSIFGPTDPARHMPPAANYKVITAGEKCAPCYKPICNKKMQCMKNISVDEVYNALMEVIKEGKSKS